MSDEEVFERARRLTAAFLYVAAAYAVPLGALMAQREPQHWSVLVAYLGPIGAGIGLCLAVAILRLGQDPLPRGLWLVGCASILGAAAADILVTVSHSPSLEDEANPIVRTLLDSGYALPFVNGFAGVAQALMIAMILVLWTAFLKHRGTILRLAMTSRPQSLPDFFKAAFGGRSLSWRQFLFPVRIRELPSSYNLFLFAAGLGVGIFQARWYLALEWLQWAPYLGWVSGVVAALLTVAAYCVWIWAAYRAEFRGGAGRADAATNR